MLRNAGSFLSFLGGDIASITSYASCSQHQIGFCQWHAQLRCLVGHVAFTQAEAPARSVCGRQASYIRSYARASRRPFRKEPVLHEATPPVADEQQVYVEPAHTPAPSELLAQVLGNSALVVTRNIEWGTVLLGYEQANQYAVLNERGETVARMAEDVTGIGNMIGRQLLRTRRRFTATVFDAEGTQVLFKMRRPAYLINSTMYIEDGGGEVIGHVERAWHPIYRKYNLFIGKRQFAEIQGAFLTWEFELRDSTGGLLALIDRNFSGFAREIFTDAGKYVIHFGTPAAAAAEEAYRVQHAVAASKKEPGPSTLPQPAAPPSTDVIVSSTGNQLVVARETWPEERMAALACAVTIDYDYFSQHSHSSGIGGGMLMPVPIPMPGGGGSGAAPGVEEGVPQVDAGAAAAHQAAANDNTQSWMDTEEDGDGGDGGDDDGWGMMGDVWDLGKRVMGIDD